MRHEPDEFERRARDVLKGQNPQLLCRLLALRGRAMDPSRRESLRPDRPTAEELNKNNQEIFDRAADLLGPVNFERIFGFQPYEKIDLVDPRIMQQQRRASDANEDKQVGAVTPVLGVQYRRRVATVTLKQLAATIAQDSEFSKKRAEQFAEEFIGEIVKHLSKGERIRIQGLGVLQVRKRVARLGRNPATGEAIQIKPAKKVVFRASKDLREAI